MRSMVYTHTQDNMMHKTSRGCAEARPGLAAVPISSRSGTARCHHLELGRRAPWLLVPHIWALASVRQLGGESGRPMRG